MEIYIIIVLALILLFYYDKETMCSTGHNIGLDYYGYRKCLDLEETKRRRGNLVFF